MNLAIGMDQDKTKTKLLELWNDLEELFVTGGGEVDLDPSAQTEQAQFLSKVAGCLGRTMDLVDFYRTLDPGMSSFQCCNEPITFV